MSRRHALAISLLLAGCAVTGAAAALKTVHLGAAAASPPRVAAPLLAARRAKLDRFAASLARASRATPPPLPPVPTYAPVVIPAPPAARPAAKVVYVRPAPVIRTVQDAPVAAPSSGWSGDDGGDDGGGDD